MSGMHAGRGRRRGTPSCGPAALLRAPPAPAGSGRPAPRWRASAGGPAGSGPPRGASRQSRSCLLARAPALAWARSAPQLRALVHGLLLSSERGMRFLQCGSPLTQYSVPRARFTVQRCSGGGPSSPCRGHTPRRSLALCTVNPPRRRSKVAGRTTTRPRFTAVPRARPSAHDACALAAAPRRAACKRGGAQLGGIGWTGRHVLPENMPPRHVHPREHASQACTSQRTCLPVGGGGLLGLAARQQRLGGLVRARHDHADRQPRGRPRRQRGRARPLRRHLLVDGRCLARAPCQAAPRHGHAGVLPCGCMQNRADKPRLMTPACSCPGPACSA